MLPPKGHISGRFPSESTPAQRELAQKLGELRRFIGLSYRDLKGLVYSSAPTLSRYFRAASIPAEVFIKDLCKVAESKATETGQQVPVSMSDLLDLRTCALQPLCSACRNADSSALLADAADVAASDRKPARPSVGKTHRKAALARATESNRRTQEPPAGPPVLPVPPPKGDRQDTPPPGPTWTGLEEVTAHLAGGRVLDALVILQNTGRSLPVHDVPVAVRAFRAAGLDAAAETVLTSAGQRDLRAVLNIAQTLNRERRHADADVLLRAASPPLRS
ncbi:hypothetical protein [Actinacidiphila oryziradicis]|uniref:Uncharacterized protein n=1 Tax=Actinacidiphila oryziradicis TaxID=2571141 RepID=A0A4U0RVC2_9ACTN|nr:hypothetical protein [Actinacidiphila oryziradicis]TKA00176.1 hypothetical protein FCI23_43345 [Actinacidiphila oryziradicis]